MPRSRFGHAIVAATVLLATIGLAALLSYRRAADARGRAAQQRLAAAAEAFPSDPLELPNDPWGTPYRIRRGADPTSVEVFSCGPDRLPDTADDVRPAKR